MPDTTHLFVYVADEGEKDISLGRSVAEIYEKSLLALGSRTDIGDWELHLKSTVMYYEKFEICLPLGS